MGYKTILLHLEPGRSNQAVLAIAGDLAEKLRADVIGVAACRPPQIMVEAGFVAGEVFEESCEEIKKRLEEVQKQLRNALAGRAQIIDWRTSVDYAAPSDYVAQQASAADLVVTATGIGTSMLESAGFNISDLVMQAGRPILIVPPDCTTLALGHIVIGWKAARESRLAIMEALPLLKLARDISVVEILASADLAQEKHGVEDVVAWLKRHGIKAHGALIAAKGDDGQRLADFAAEKKADLIVAGAYGHSRVRAWVLGGVTRNYLLRPDRCVLVAH